MVSFIWGSYPKKFPEDEEEIKRAIKKLLHGSSTNFNSSLREALRQTRKTNQTEQFMEIMNRLFNEVLDENIYDFLEEKNALSSLYVIPKDATAEDKKEIKEKIERKFKKITYKDILTNSKLVNDLIGFSFIKFGRRLEKIPQTFNSLDDKKIMDAVEIESEFILREGQKEVKIGETKETVKIPSGKISFSVSNNKSLKDTHSIIKIGEQTSQIEAKKKFIENRGVSNFKFVSQKNSKQKIIRELFPFKLDLPKIAKLTKGINLDSIKVSKLTKSKATRARTKERETINPFTGKTKKVKPKSVRIEGKENFRDTKSIKDYFKENQLNTILDIISALSTKNDNNPTFTYGKNTYRVESFGFLRGKNEYIVADLSDDLDDFIISWFDDKKSTILKPIKSMLNNPIEINLIEIQCKVTTKSRGTGSLPSYQKKAKSKSEANENIESLVELVSSSKIPKENLDRIQQLEKRIDYLESPDRPIPKSIKTKEYNYKLKNAPKNAYAQLATKKVEAYKLKKVEEIKKMIKDKKLYDSKKRVEINQDYRIDANKRIEERNKKIKNEEDKEKEIKQKIMSLNDFIVATIMDNKIIDKNKPQAFSMYDTFKRPILVKKDDKNFEEIKRKINTIRASEVGESGKRIVLSDLFDKIYEKTTVEDFDINDKNSFITKRKYDSKQREYEKDMKNNPYPSIRLVNRKRIDFENKEDYTTSSKTVNKKLTNEERKVYRKAKSLTPSQLETLIQEAEKEIEALKKPVREVPLSAERAKELQETGQFSLTEIQDNNITVRQSDDFGRIDVGESAEKENLVEALKDATLVCDYYIRKLGYFNFNPFTKGKGKEGVNKKLKEEIDNLAVKVRRVKRYGLEVK